MPTITQGAAVPGLYSHIAQSEDKEDTEIHQNLKALNQSRGKTEKEGKLNNSISKTSLLFRYKRSSTPMMISTLFIILKIIEANPESEDHTEANITVDLSEVKIPMVEASEIKMHTKVNIKAPIIKAITTKVIAISTTIHVEFLSK